MPGRATPIIFSFPASWTAQDSATTYPKHYSCIWRHCRLELWQDLESAVIWVIWVGRDPKVWRPCPHPGHHHQCNLHGNSTGSLAHLWRSCVTSIAHVAGSQIPSDWGVERCKDGHVSENIISADQLHVPGQPTTGGGRPTSGMPWDERQTTYINTPMDTVYLSTYLFIDVVTYH